MGSPQFPEKQSRLECVPMKDLFNKLTAQSDLFLWRARSLAVLLLIASSYSLLGQDRTTVARPDRLGTPTLALPSDLLPHVDAIGDRLRRPGKEETVLEG